MEGIDERRLRERHWIGKELGRSDLLLGAPAPRLVVPVPLPAASASCASIALYVEAVGAHPHVIGVVVDEHGELVGSPLFRILQVCSRMLSADVAEVALIPPALNDSARSPSQVCAPVVDAVLVATADEEVALCDR